MRIIGGAAKGRKLKSPKSGSLIKPIMSRARQSFFDTIRPWITGSRFLDLFAGSGAVGLEALSRGASFAAFVERSKEGLRLISLNLEKLGFQEKALVFQGDVVGGGLFLLRNSLPQETRFDIVFVAPPYLGDNRRGEILRLSVPAVRQLLEAGLLEPGAWILLQHHKKEPMEDMPWEMKVVRTSRFGETQFTYLRYQPPDA